MRLVNQMVDRIVRVSITAQVGNYLAGMEQARRANEKTGMSAADLQAKLEQQNQAMTAAGVGLLAVGALAAAGVGVAVKKFAEFDSAMSEVQASTHESTANMGLLRDAAIDAGAKTVFSATEAANAIDELAKAGLSTADILGGALDGALSLASAGGLGVAEAAATAATALTLFKLKGEDIPHVADLLAAGAGKAQGSVEDLSQALNQGGLVASQAGFTIEETTGVLAAFAAAGLKGSDAGTSLKTAIIALQKPSTQAQGIMDKYGISVYDANGQMLSFSGIANQLTTKLGNLTDEQRNSALATIFGTDAVRSAAVLYTNGAKGIDAWNAKVNDSGYAAETARLKLDNLNGDLEQLGGSFDTAVIKTGSAANDVLRGMVQNITGLVNAFGAAPPIVQQVALGASVLTAVVGLLGGAFLVGVPKLAAFSTGLAVMSASTIPAVAAASTLLTASIARGTAGLASFARFLTGPFGIAVVAAAVSLAFLKKAMDDSTPSAAAIDNAMSSAATAADLLRASTQRGGPTEFFFGDYAKELEKLPVLLDKVKNDGWDFMNLTFVEKGAVQSLDRLGERLAALAEKDLPAAQVQFAKITQEYKLNEKQQYALLESMGPYKDALIKQATALGINVTSADEAANKTALLKLAQEQSEAPALKAADAYLAVADAAAETDSNLLKLIETINKANGVGQDASSANIAYQKTLDDVDAQIQKINEGTEGYAKTLDITTAAGRDNRTLLDDLAKSNQDAATAQFNLDGNTDAFKKTLEAGRQAVIDRAIDLGATAEQAQALADNIAKVPTDIAIKALLDASQPDAELDALRTKFKNIGGMLMTLPALQALTIPMRNNPFALADGKAGGGTVFGPGTSKSDSVPHMLSVGEEVIQEPYASMYRQQLKQMNNGTYAGAAPIQYAASSGYSRSSSAGSAGRGDINASFTLNEITDPVGTATAVMRHMKALGI
jgi:TP901 family phage tail tape measure protein